MAEGTIEDMVGVGSKRLRTSSFDGDVCLGKDGVLSTICTKLGKIEIQCSSNGRMLKDIQQVPGDVAKLKAQQATNTKDIAELKAQVEGIREMCIDTKTFLFSKSLIFFKIPERRNENTYWEICDFLYYRMKVADPHKLLIDSASRLGRFRRGKTRPIVVAFAWAGHMDIVKNHCKNLSGTNFSVREYFT